jgi:hypothetical protein
MSGAHILLHRSLLLAAFGTALYFVLTTIIGMINSYTPVPYWDMWGGTLGFYMVVSAQRAPHCAVADSVLAGLHTV